MKYTIPFGKYLEEFNLPDGLEVDLILPVNYPPKQNIDSYIQNSFLHPVDKIKETLFKNGNKVGIAINDPTRPVPHSILLPPLLEYLRSKGVKEEDIYFFIATGTHKPTCKEELFQILPDSIINRYHIKSHDCDKTET